MPMEGDSGARGPVVNRCLLKTVGAMEFPAYGRCLSELITWPERPLVRLCLRFLLPLWEIVWKG